MKSETELLKKWLQLCEMGLGDVVPDWVKPTIQQLWDETDNLLNGNPAVNSSQPDTK